MSVPERRKRRPEDIAGAPEGQAAVSDKSIVTSVPRSGELRQETVQPQVQQEQDVSSQPLAQPQPQAQPQAQPKPQQPLVQNQPQGQPQQEGQLPPQQEAQAQEQETPQSDVASVPGAAPEQGVAPEPSAALSVTNEQGGQQGDVKPKQEQSQSQQDANAPSVSSEQDDEAQRRQQFESSIGSLNLDGNLDRSADRGIVSQEEMKEAGYADAGQSATESYFYPMGFSPKKDGKPVDFVVNYTPITPDGGVVSANGIEDYIQTLYDLADGDWAKMKELDASPDGLHILLGKDMSEDDLVKLEQAYYGYYHPSSRVSSAPSQGESSGGASSSPSSTPTNQNEPYRLPVMTRKALQEHGVDLSTWQPPATGGEAEYFAEWKDDDLRGAMQDVYRWLEFNRENNRANKGSFYKGALNFWLTAEAELKRRRIEPYEGYEADAGDYNYYKRIYEGHDVPGLMKIWSSGSRGELITQVVGDILADKGVINEGETPWANPFSPSAASQPSSPTPAASQPAASTPAPPAPKDEPKQGDEGQGDNTSKSEDDVQDNDKPKPEEEPQSDTPTTDWKAQYRDNSVEDLETIISTAQSIADNPDTPERERALMQDKVRQLTELRDEKRGASGSEPSASSSPSASDNAPRYSRRQQKLRDEVAEAMGDERINGNVDIKTHPVANPADLRAAGYNVKGDSPTLGIQQIDVEGKDAGQYYSVYYTPIKSNGTILSQDEADKYFRDMGGKGDVVALDKNGLGIVVRVVDKNGDDVNQNFGDYVNGLRSQYDSTPEDYRQMAEEASAFLSGMNGNQNPVAYKPVSKKALVDAGWVAAGQSEDEEFYAWPVEQDIVDDKGEKHHVVMTPITPDGDILSPQDFADYVSSLQDNPDILGADKADSSLILMYDCDAGAANDVYNNIGTWVMGQADPEEGQRPSYRGEYIDDTRNTLVQNVATLQQQIDDLNETIRNFLEHPESTTRGAMLLDEYNNGLKAEGLTAEDERRREKSNRTARIIANLGDVLQGFANLAGTWYGAKSQELSSVTGGVDARHKTEGDARAKRAEELRKSYKEGIDRIYKEFNTDLTSLRKMWMDAVNRLADFDKASGLEAQRSSNVDKRQERNQRRKEAENRRRERFQMERDAQKQKDRKEMADINQRNAMARINRTAEERRKTQAAPRSKAR